MTPSILIIEDDLTFATMLKTWLGKKGFEVDTAGSSSRAKKQLSARSYDLILSDLRLPDQDGIHLLAWLRSQSCTTPFIIMTSYAEIQTAVQAIKQGASDYIAKPVQPDELLKKIKEAIQKSEVPDTPSEAHIEKNTPQSFLEGESEAAHQLFSYVRLVAPTQMSVLINGASGTGKEYVAHRIHELSKRNGKPFIAIDCGSIPKDLAASEFFGHIKGSFTGALNDKVGAFEEANGGAGNSRCLPTGLDKTALKRINMALRWLVRDDGIVDMGVWKSIKPSQLFIPLDVHVGNTARSLGMLTRKANDKRSVLELTSILRKIRPDDPVFYDYALFGIGVGNKYTGNQSPLI